MISKQKTYLKVKDHSVSQEEFELVLDESLDYLITTPQPAPDKLPGYYESEDYISHTDGKRSLFERVYHLVKGYALSKKVFLINSFETPQRKLLDVGAGTGDFLVAAKQSDWNVSGVEPNKQAIANAAEKGIRLVENLDTIKDEKFDVITLWHVLEHLPDLENQIRKLNTLLKPDGILVIAVPNFKSYDAQYYKEYWAAFDVPRHLWHFSQNAINRIFGKQGFHVEKVLPMYFDAFYVSLLSEKYKRGKMNPVGAFFRGWKSNRLAKQSGEYSSLIYVLKK